MQLCQNSGDRESPSALISLSTRLTRRQVDVPYHTVPISLGRIRGGDCARCSCGMCRE